MKTEQTTLLWSELTQRLQGRRLDGTPSLLRADLYSCVKVFHLCRMLLVCERYGLVTTYTPLLNVMM